MKTLCAHNMYKQLITKWTIQCPCPLREQRSAGSPVVLPCGLPGPPRPGRYSRDTGSDPRGNPCPSRAPALTVRTRPPPSKTVKGQPRYGLRPPARQRLLHSRPVRTRPPVSKMDKGRPRYGLGPPGEPLPVKGSCTPGRSERDPP